jgi:hypothetical protein
LPADPDAAEDPFALAEGGRSGEDPSDSTVRNATCPLRADGVI